jgi:hypothetical protein
VRYGIIRGFFKRNRIELPKEDFRIRGDKPKVQTNLTIEELRQMVISSNKCYRAIWLCMFMGGMGQDEFIYWSNNGAEKLQEDLKKSLDPIIVNLPGRKSLKYERPYYTIITGDALEALKEYWKEKNKTEKEKTKTIFTNQYLAPVTKTAIYAYWRRHLESQDIITPPKEADSSTRYGRGPHELRDLFRSQWEKSPAKGSVAEFMMGHVIDELGYNQAYRDRNWVLKEYHKALPMLNILTSDRPYGKVDESEVDKLRKELNQLREEKQNKESQDRELWEIVKALKDEVSNLKKQLEEKPKT